MKLRRVETEYGRGKVIMFLMSSSSCTDLQRKCWMTHCFLQSRYPQIR